MSGGETRYRPDGTAAPLAWRWIALETLFVFTTCAFFFWFALSPDDRVLEGDTLFHFKMARLILEHGPWVSIDNLPYTVLGTHGTDQQWLYHVLVAPLTLIGSKPVDVSIVAVLVAAAMTAAFVPTLRRNLVPFAPVICILMVVSSRLLPHRYLSLRAQDFALPLMVAMMFVIVARKRWWAAIGAFVFMQGYHAAVILGMMVVVTVAVDKLRGDKPDWKTLLAVFYGGSLGLILSPWFPDNVRYLLFHTVFKVAQAEGADSGLIGTEWFKPSWTFLLVESWQANLLYFGMMATAGWLAWRKRMRWSTVAIVSCVATLVFLLMYRFQGWRFSEYYGPFAVLSAAILWRDIAAAAPAERQRAVLYYPAFAVALLAGVLMYFAVYITSGMPKMAVNRYREQMAYVEAHDPQPMVFNSQWEDYVTLFYHSRNAKFVAGLDGHFLKLGDPERFRAWYSIIRGGMRNSPAMAATMHDLFKARWAVVAAGETGFAAALYHDRNARLVVANEDGWLFELKSDGTDWK